MGLRDIEVAYRMFERWRQENFFKYMREEFLLDALVDYRIEPEDPTRTIPNPERRALDKEIRVARADLAKLEREYGAAAADNAEQRRPTMRGFRSLTANSESSCARPVLASLASSSGAATSSSASRCATSASEPWSSSLRNAST